MACRCSGRLSQIRGVLGFGWLAPLRWPTLRRLPPFAAAVMWARCQGRFRLQGGLGCSRLGEERRLSSRRSRGFLRGLDRRLHRRLVLGNGRRASCRGPGWMYRGPGGMTYAGDCAIWHLRRRRRLDGPCSGPPGRPRRRLRGQPRDRGSSRLSLGAVVRAVVGERRGRRRRLRLWGGWRSPGRAGAAVVAGRCRSLRAEDTVVRDPAHVLVGSVAVRISVSCGLADINDSAVFQHRATDQIVRHPQCSHRYVSRLRANRSPAAE